MDDLRNHELLQPAHISKLLDEIIPDDSQYYMTTIIPLVTQDTDEVIVDVRDNIGGMTQAVAQGAESPMVEFRGQSQFKFTPAHFREKTVLSERDLKVIRKIGTASELAKAEDRVAEVVGGLRMRLETRIEWCKWQMVFGTLDIDQTDVQFSVDYGIPADYTPTLAGVDKWDALATADPVDDIIEWAYLFRDEGIDPEYLLFTRAVEKLLLQNTTLRELAEAHYTNTGKAEMNTARLNEMLKTFAGYAYKVYDKGYFFKMKLETPVTPASTSFIVSENPGVNTGDEVTLIHKSGSRLPGGKVKVTVTPTGLSFAHAAIGGTVTFPAGSTVRIKKRFIPDNLALLMGAVPPGTTGGTDFAEFVSTPSPYNGGIMNAQPGPFGKVVVDDDGDPPKVSVIAGISGLPVLYHPTCNLIATVY
ncbi:MAG: major capsid protein [Candidatus Thorarchaeota archaeon]|nr:MAG: hypothetical protein DRQ25_04925 [Candidatus Fermentibacteria bacterium]HEC72026.1 hypothetical protein [Thermoplasmatales archaeon]